MRNIFRQSLRMTVGELRMTGGESRMTVGESRMTVGESRMTVGESRMSMRRAHTTPDENDRSYRLSAITTVVTIFAERLPPITPPTPPARGGEPLHEPPPLAGGLGGVIHTTTAVLSAIGYFLVSLPRPREARVCVEVHAGGEATGRTGA